ncbi:Uncharacterized protein TCM_031702 [Theobroma cacao]|uniref:Uncharacterized protein n=1 Tax=Theobroma cacao TaxID=3641 RepID=A0A061F930_THECC|nr:Uncharacterized protein TCM_031702 [Theobroma cacao]
MWQQKSKVDWIKFGDSNSKFYHGIVKGRQRRKKIVTLKRDDGSWCYDQEELKRMAIHYYLNLYTDDGISTQLPENLDWWLDVNVKEELSKPITLQVVKNALFDMNPNKSLSFDGFPTGFFRYEYWGRFGEVCTKGI